MRPTLIVFAKAPRYGAVKRRLAAEVGALVALRFYRSNLDRLLRRLGRDRRWRCRLAVTGGPARWPRGLKRQPQRGTDLGARMLNALRGAPPGPVVLIGADIPGIRPVHIAAAFRRLAGADIVFGPAEDGGFWLVGLRDHSRDPFRNVRWSTRHALADTLKNVRGRFAFVARLADVDDAAALRKTGG